MKYLIFGIALIFFYTNIYSQSERKKCISHFDSLSNIEVFEDVDKMPIVEGGENKLFEAISNVTCHVKWNGGPTKVIIAFVIDTNGKMIGKRIIQDLEYRDYILEIFPHIAGLKWIPGMCNNKIVPVLFKLPIQLDFK